MANWIDLDSFISKFPSPDLAKARIEILFKSGYIEIKHEGPKKLMRLTETASSTNSAFVRMIYDLSKIAIMEFLDSVQTTYDNVRKDLKTTPERQEHEQLTLAQIALSTIEAQARNMVEYSAANSSIPDAVRTFVDNNFDPKESLCQWQETDSGKYPKSIINPTIQSIADLKKVN